MSRTGKYSGLSDEKIWQDFKAGEVEAFDFIFDTYIKILYHQGDRITSDNALVEDSVQELFIELWQKKANLGTPASIKYYLLKALRRKIIRKIQQQKANIVLDDTDLGDIHSTASIEFSYEAQLIEH